MDRYYIYGVNFKDNGKIYNFKSKIRCPINVTVITETEKGLQFGKVVNYLNSDNIKNIDELKDIIRISTKKDYEEYLKNLRDADQALKQCRMLVKELNLDMKMINASYTFDRKQLIFNFLADERIDFRELARRLASIYRTRIELRQIGARVNHIDSVSMNMAKNQGLALNPSKINGLCGRLLCCLTYEDEEYLKCSEGLPNIGEIVKTELGEGPVVNVDILNRAYKVLVNNERVEIYAGEENASTK